jgi:hypothetical protein
MPPKHSRAQKDAAAKKQNKGRRKWKRKRRKGRKFSLIDSRKNFKKHQNYFENLNEIQCS